ncbi:hypothetical protein RJ639_043556 [Escallonia herrerae]|uniref:MSP domain-containing protein n=1 Tax=Escallonia herrerae TaxID=1293975 RepID=A0AA88WJG4_9ASTE|nr:hypothetical protein RJ639_043556 [Escallonia herrerae]
MHTLSSQCLPRMNGILFHGSLCFTVELKKQSSCSLRLVNRSNDHVAFKVKTTSPKKYCVRPNTGIVKPQSTCYFVVTMQAQRVIPHDMTCKDKFLLQSTVVPEGTTDEDITPSMFAKDYGKYVQEKKLRVILVGLSPPDSPVLSPINGTLKQLPAYQLPTLEDQLLSTVDNYSSDHKVSDSSIAQDVGRDFFVEEFNGLLDMEEFKMGYGEQLELAKDVESKTRKDVDSKTTKDVESETTKDVQSKTTKDVDFNTTEDVESKTTKDVEDLKLVKDIEEMKSKLNDLELKLREAEVTISKLTEDRRLTTQEGVILRKELGTLRSSRDIRKVQVGFPLLFVCMVALVSLMLGYYLHR